MEINIYHILEGKLVSTLTKLLEKIYLSQKKCIFFSPISERVEIIDKALWTFSTNAFIPHGSKKIGFSDMQPIYFTDKYENPNDAEVLLMVDSFDYSNFDEGLEKIMIVFEDLNQLTEANTLYQTLKNADKNVNYWKQSTKEWKRVIT